MKKLVVSSAIAVIIAAFVTAASGQESRSANLTPEKISFYEVPLVCGAAPDIGCGSRAKPALLEMEQNLAVKEAWLNRAGTVYAVVWRKNSQTKRIARPIFKKYAIEFSELGDKEKTKHLDTFRQEGKWYRGAAVDQLSLEEAERLGQKVVDMLLPEGHITEKEAEALRQDVTAYFKSELVKLRTCEELCQDSDAKFQQAVIGILEKQVGKVRAEKIVARFGIHKE